MTVTPMLGDWEVPRIALMRTEEARKLQAYPIPGRAGSVYQDLGAEATIIDIAGSIYLAEERSRFMEDARSRFLAAEPLTFVADITEATDIQYVIIESLVLEERGDRPDEVAYRMRLRESPPPPPPPDPFGAIDSDLLGGGGRFRRRRHRRARRARRARQHPRLQRSLGAPRRHDRRGAGGDRPDRQPRRPAAGPVRDRMR